VDQVIPDQLIVFFLKKLIRKNIIIIKTKIGAQPPEPRLRFPFSLPNPPLLRLPDSLPRSVARVASSCPSLPGPVAFVVPEGAGGDPQKKKKKRKKELEVGGNLIRSSARQSAVSNAAGVCRQRHRRHQGVSSLSSYPRGDFSICVCGYSREMGRQGAGNRRLQRGLVRALGDGCGVVSGLR
jgi:hypothetical protein